MSSEEEVREDSLLDLLDYSGEGEAMDLHKACRLGDLKAIEFAYRAQPEKINSKDANV